MREKPNRRIGISTILSYHIDRYVDDVVVRTGYTTRRGATRYYFQCRNGLLIPLRRLNRDKLCIKEPQEI